MSESAIRELASSYPNDTYEGHDNEALTLRGAKEQVNGHLVWLLNNRLHRAGIRVSDARISHLAYAPEIANAMLKR